MACSRSPITSIWWKQQPNSQDTVPSQVLLSSNQLLIHRPQQARGPSHTGTHMGAHHKDTHPQVMSEDTHVSLTAHTYTVSITHTGVLPHIHTHTHICKHLSVTILCACVCMCAQSCLTLCNPMDCSPPGSSVHGISRQEY